MRFMVIICFLLSLTGCLTTYCLNEGISSFKAQDYRRAFIKLKPLAENGQRDAQYAIGFMYYYGQGVVEDRIKALYWIDCAAKSGNPDAIAAMKIIQTSK